MPGTLIAPTPGEPFGPGFLIRFESDFIGPFAPGTRWTVEYFDHLTEEFLFANTADQPAVSHIMFDYVWMGWNDVWNGNAIFGHMLNGRQVEMRIQLVDPDGAVLDSVINTGVWDAVTGIPVLLTQIKNRIDSSSAISVDLADIKAASFASFGSQLVPISQLIQSPPIGLLVRELIGDLTGEGTLTRPVGGFNVNAFGLAWEVQAAGEGIGVSEGAPDMLVTHMLDLQLVHTLADANNETTSIARFAYGDAMWLFSPMLPHEVKYWIGPSITLRMYWLLVV